VVQAVHTTVKGRARYKVEGLYRSESLKQLIEQDLGQHECVKSVSINTLTGTVLILYDSGNGHHTLAIAELLNEIVENHRLASSAGRMQREKGTRSATTGSSDATGSGPLTVQRDKPAAPLQAGEKTPSLRKVRSQVTHADKQPEVAWHCMTEHEVLREWEASGTKGLSHETAQLRLAQYGPNLLPESVPRSGWSIFFDQFKSLPVGLLGVAAGISVFTGGIADAAVILGVVMINASIGYTTERQTEKTIHGLKSLVQPTSTIIRDGALQVMDAKEVVPGDLLVLRPGSYIAADARLLESDYLSVDESTLTGESMPVTKTIRQLQDPDVPLGDRTNMIYMGTLVTGGQGLAVVVATGRFTEMGKIQTLVGEARPPDTPMERQMDKMGIQLVIISGAVCGIVFIIGLLRGYGFLQMLKTSIALAVAAVPEGLPTIATTTLALGIRRMRDLNVLIRHLDAVEALGAVQTICLDKTGTITLNRMSVVEVHAGMQSYEVSDGRISADGKTINPYVNDELLRLIHLSVLCNESVVARQEGEYSVEGSSTENALIHMALAAGVDVNALRSQYPLSKINHRSEDRHFMSTIHRADAGQRLLALKGSPSEVLALCRWYLKDGERHLLDDQARDLLDRENERMAGDALRVLAVCYAVVGESGLQNGDDMGEGLTWVGLIGMADIVRPGVKNLIGKFHHAGIDTVMITGDQGPTAYAIGKQLNLSKDEELEILDSSSLSQLEPDVMAALAGRVHVFARVSPASKLQIVQALQSAGKVVAMTGDGINDGPALKAADIGIAMGHTGTDVAREVADVVLEDDNLETMVIAISQGRTVYNNIRKSVRFLLATNMSEIMVMFTAMAGGMGQPLNVMQLLWINLISDIFPGLALALEPPEPDILSRPPRDPNDPIIKPQDFKRILFEASAISAGSLAAYGYGLARYGQGAQAGSMAFMSLCTGQLLHAISCRSETHSIFDSDRLASNKNLTVALAGSLGIQTATMFVPGLRQFLGLSPLGPLDAIIAVGSAVVPLIINEATKKPAVRLSEGEGNPAGQVRQPAGSPLTAVS
jgi:P-type Ca2+ transporter type 2C